MSKSTKLMAPVAKRIPTDVTVHDDPRIDNYFWMRLSDEQKNAEHPDNQTQDVLDYLNAENAFLEQELAHTKDFQRSLFDEIVGRIKQTDMSVPYRDNGYYYYTRFEEGKEYPIHARKKSSLDALEEITFDLNIMAKGHEFYNIGSRKVSPNNELVAFGEDTVSRRIYTIRFKNLVTGEILADALPGTTGSVAWMDDNKTVFYTKKEIGTLRSYKVYKHILGTAIDQDQEIFHESDDNFGCAAYRSKSGKFIFIVSYSTLANEIRFIKSDDYDGAFAIIEPRPASGQKLEYSVAHFGDKFYILTNHEAENFKLVTTTIDQPQKENWTDLIAHRSDVLLENIEIFEQFLVVTERINGITELRIIPWQEGSAEHHIAFEEEAHYIYASVNKDFDTDILRFGYTSLTTPNSIFDYNMSTQERTLLKQQEVISDTFDPKNYESKRLFATTKDGVTVPISIVNKKGIRLDGNNPLLLYAYGSYGNSMDPYFTSTRLSLLDRGVTFAIAHIRGGSEMGRQWYEDGKMFKKTNTFNDFIECAQHLIKAGYTNSEKIFAMGGSAGGLLMGAVMNMAPELFKGIIAAVPFVDVVNTMLDETIPLTTGEFHEWGNPKIKEQYEYIKSYSPYDQVDELNYPILLITTGLHDSQVQYWEPAKWVAKLREYNKSDNPIYLHTNMKTGHSGASGRFERYKETALEYAFLLDILGINA